MTSAATALTCRELNDFLADYFAAELGLDERLRFEGHVAACPECITYLGSYAETMRLAREAYHDEGAPGGVPEPLVRAILAARRRHRGH